MQIQTSREKLSVDILVFGDVEVLDFAGPFEVFGVAAARPGPAPFSVRIVALERSEVIARNGLELRAQTVSALERPNILVVPGGYGTRRELNNPKMIEYIRKVGGASDYILSVCTGALLLARAGLLEGLSATTHHGAMHATPIMPLLHCPFGRIQWSQQVPS